MKAHILLIIFLVCAMTLSAQVRINSDGSAPDASAMLDVKSTTSGVLIPRMTATQRDAISSPATGLMIFCTDYNQFYYNKGTPTVKNWIIINSLWLSNGTDIYSSAGNIGIGTSTPHAPLQFANSAVNRKIVMFDNNNNDHQYYGFGINGSTLRYQVDATTCSHVFYAGTSSTSSAELMRIRGDGKVGIGINDLSYKLEIANDNLGNTAGNTVLWQRIRGQSANTDQLQIFHRRYTAGTGWESAEIRVQKVVDATAMHYISFKGGTVSTLGYLVFGFQNSEQMVVTNDGNIGTGTSNPQDAAILDVSSTSRGFLPPRMNSSEISYIQSPANGLTVFNVTDAHLYVYTQWDNLWKRVSHETTVIAPFTCGVPFPDGRDGNIYGTVQIGTQCWMNKNLAYLPNVHPSASGSSSSPYYYVFSYQGTDVSAAKATSIYQTYGVLYNYPASKISCPSGWHLPTDAEYCTLTTYLDATVDCSASGFPQGWTGTDAGGKMKETGTAHWYGSNYGATNSSGFTAFGGGMRSAQFLDFQEFNLYGYWWSYSGYVRELAYNEKRVNRNFPWSDYGFSVRCLKD